MEENQTNFESGINEFVNEAYSEDNETEDVEIEVEVAEVQIENHSVNEDDETKTEEKVRTTPPPPYSQVVSRKNKVNSDNADGSSASDIEFELETFPVPEDSSKWYTVDTFMLPAKLAYFFDQFKEASIWPFLILFQVSIGLSPRQAGIINGMRFIGCLFGAPIWGAIADQKRIHRQLIMVIVACAILFQCSQPFWGEGYGPEELNRCPSNRTLKSAEEEAKSGQIHNTKLFHILLIISITACFFDGTTLTFADSGCQKRIRSTTRTIDFGRTRLFGSIGYGVGSVASSTALKYFPHTHITCFAGPFFMYFCCSVCLIISFNFLYRGIKDNPSDAPTEKSSSDPKVRKILWETLKSFDTIFFLATVLFNGLMRALVFSFTYLYLKELGADDMLLGYSMFVSQVSSVVFYAVSEKLIDVCGGTMQVMCLSCFSWVIRLLCLAYMKNYYLILPINALNGITASLFVASSIIHVRRTCSPVVITTMLGTRNALFNGGGYIIAGVVGGQLYQSFGAKRLFLDTCFLCAAWVLTMIAHILYQKYRVAPKTMSIELQERKEERKEATEIA